jgi:hypothetical protein
VSLVRDAHATYDDELPASETSRQVEEELEAAGVSVVWRGGQIRVKRRGDGRGHASRLVEDPG